MLDSFSQIGVVWLGILTATSPCLLAMNIAAIAYLGRLQNVWFAGTLYALGQVFAFWGLTVLVVGIPFFIGEQLFTENQITLFLSSTLTALLGPLLILIGMVLAGLIRFPLPSWDGETTKRISDRFGKWGALPLGIMLALAFCPTTAVLFFSMLALTAERMIATESVAPLMILPALFGLGASIPILIFAGILATQRELLSTAFQKVTGMERPARWITGGIFIIVGLWLTIRRFVLLMSQTV